MIRINLLPPEIIEKRKAEGLWGYVVYAALALFAVLFGVFLVMYVQVSAAQSEVAAKQTEAASLESQASNFKVFEDRQSDLTARQAMASKALAGRVDWSRLFTEVALVLPSDVWLKNMHGNEKALTITGVAVDGLSDDASTGFKPVAKMLVRMSDLGQLKNVWLDTSVRADYLGKSTVDFSLGADVATETAAVTTRVVAPPTKP